MKKYIIWAVLAAMNLKGSQLFSQCNNGDVEFGNFTNWTGYTGLFNTPQNLLTPGFFMGRHSVITGTGMDPYGFFPVVDEGNYSIKIGNTSTGAQADMVSYSFLVTPANVDFQFKYAIVFEDPGHDKNEQPDFSFYMKTESIPGVPTAGSSASNITLYNATHNEITADINNPFFKISTVNNQVIYKSWVCVRYNLTQWIGQTVTIFFRVRDCALAGHWGYAYIDGLCKMNIPIASFTGPDHFCDLGDAELYVDGSNSSFEDIYEWSIGKLGTPPKGGTPGLVLTNIASKWFFGQQAGLFNIKQLYKQKGFDFECNKFYVIKLKVLNQCGKSAEVSKVIQFTCPIVNAGPDQATCCKQPGYITIGPTPPFGKGIYSWTSNPTGFVSNDPSPIVYPKQSTTYTLTVTDTNGCKGYDQVNVLVLQPFEVTIDYACLRNLICNYDKCGGGILPVPDVSYPKPLICDPVLKAVINYRDCFPSNNQFQQLNDSKIMYEWSTGETTQEIEVKPGITEYSVTITNGCFTKTVTINNVIPGGYFSQEIPAIAAPKAILPNGTTAQQVCKIYEYGPSAPLFGTGPAYHAYRYRLRIYDRLGHVIYCKQDCNPCGFVNGEIQWDGKTNNGNLVPLGVYNAQLTLWNCVTNNIGDTKFNIYRGKHLECTKYVRKFPFFQKECVEYKNVDDYEPTRAFSITVIH